MRVYVCESCKIRCIVNVRFLFIHSEEIRFLENKLNALEDRYGDVKKLTATAVAKSDAVSKEALSLLILGINLPAVNVTDLQNRIDDINKEVNYLYC